VIGIAPSSFQSPAGYLQLLKVIHAAPWFQSVRPKAKEEVEIWQNKAAFIDAIFYN